eukprot:gene6792-356_t
MSGINARRSWRKILSKVTLEAPSGAAAALRGVAAADSPPPVGRGAAGVDAPCASKGSECGEAYADAAAHAQALARVADRAAGREATMVGETLDFYARTCGVVEAVVRRLERYELSYLTERDRYDAARRDAAGREVAGAGCGWNWRWWEWAGAAAGGVEAERAASHAAAWQRFGDAAAAFDDDWERFLRRFSSDWTLLRRLIVELQVASLREAEQLPVRTRTPHPPDPERHQGDAAPSSSAGIATALWPDAASPLAEV